ncbi:MAG: hypothetical protein ACYCZF_16415 [Anaerolineae bacterium]
MSDLFFGKDAPFQKWVWIELIGLNNELADFGVSDYIRRAGFVPHGVSLLLFSLGFVFRHDGLDHERPLSPCEQSYAGHEYSSERRRQNWTNYQLKSLIKVLQSHGCKVYLSFLNLYQYTSDAGEVVGDAYFQSKSYLHETFRDGRQQKSIGMLKHLDEGLLFEDVFQTRTIRALQDYDFNGIQIADGISSPRLSLQEGDYSDDMVGQFLAHSAINLPSGLKPSADGDAQALQARAEWIWQEKRKEWIYFYTWRWGQFYEKFVQRLQHSQKEAIFNSAWTRDPFEAIYRYGVDYRKVARTGIDGCMVEDVAPALAILSKQDNGYLMNDEKRRRLHYEFITALMLIRATMPALRITPLSGVHDTMEQWGVLEHMPTSMTRNTMSNLNTYIYANGRLKPITDGPFFCLADGLSESDWNFIRKNWDIGYTHNAQSVCGATLIWSDARLDQELDAFIRNRRTPTHRLVSELLYAGAPISAVARIEDLQNVTGTILVTNADLLPPEEQRALWAYDRGTIILVGCREQDLTQQGLQAVVEDNTFGGIKLHVLGICEGLQVVHVENDTPYTFDAKRSNEAVGGLWTHPLQFAPISPAFYTACAAYIVNVSRAPVIAAQSVSETGQPRQVCKYIAIKIAENTYRVFISNDDYYYNHPTLDMGRGIKHVTCLTKYPGYKVDFHQSSFTARIPGRGMEAFEVILQ